MAMYYANRAKRARDRARARARRHMTPEQRKAEDNAGLLAVIFWVAVVLFVCWLTTI